MIENWLPRYCDDAVLITIITEHVLGVGMHLRVVRRGGKVRRRRAVRRARAAGLVAVRAVTAVLLTHIAGICKHNDNLLVKI